MQFERTKQRGGLGKELQDQKEYATTKQQKEEKWKPKKNMY